MNHRFRVLLAAVALCGAMNHAATAQVAIAPFGAQVPLEERKSRHYLRVKNVPASLMAFWLDPTNHPLPIALQAKGPMANPYLLLNPPYLMPVPSNKPIERAEANKNRAGGIFDLPEGIDRIVAVDPQNALLVFGTDAGFEELQETAKFLDRPLRQVEIEAQWVMVSPENAKAFGIQNDGATDLKSPQLGFVRGNSQATLSKLLMEGKAKVITAPRISAINNVPASMNRFMGLDAEVHLNDAGNELNGLFAGTTQIGTEYTLSFVPTINSDNTITIKITTAATLKMRTANGTELTASRPTNSIETVVNGRDGGTIALGGIVTSQLSAPQTENKNPPSNLIVFITPRVVRRAGDEVQTVAPKR